MFDKIRDRFLGIKQLLKGLWNNPALLEDLDTYSFIGTLLPIPGWKEVADVVNKLANDQALKLNEVTGQFVTSVGGSIAGAVGKKED